MGYFIIHVIMKCSVCGGSDDMVPIVMQGVTCLICEACGNIVTGTQQSGIGKKNRVKKDICKNPECGQTTHGMIMDTIEGVWICPVCATAQDQVIDYSDEPSYNDKDDGSQEDNRRTTVIQHCIHDVMIPGKLLPNYCLGTGIGNTLVKKKDPMGYIGDRIKNRHKYLYTADYNETALRTVFYEFITRLRAEEYPTCIIDCTIYYYSQLYNYEYTCSGIIERNNLCKYHNADYKKIKDKCADYLEESRPVRELKETIKQLREEQRADMDACEGTGQSGIDHTDEIQEKCEELYSIRKNEKHKIFKIKAQYEALINASTQNAYCLVKERLIKRQSNKVAIEAACIYKACEACKFPRTVGEIAELWNTTAHIVAKGIKYFEKFMAANLNIQTQEKRPRDATEYIEANIAELNHPNPQFRKTCLNLLNLVRTSVLYQTHTPEVLASGCMFYTHFILLGGDIKDNAIKRSMIEYKTKISKICGVSPASVENLRQRIHTYLTELRETTAS